MSNTIPSLDRKGVYTNVMGNHIMIDEDGYLFSEFLPVLLHYIKGGLFGHAPCFGVKNSMIGINKKELKAIEDFIASVKKLEKVTLKDGNIAFEEKHEKNNVIPKDSTTKKSDHP